MEAENELVCVHFLIGCTKERSNPLNIWFLMMDEVGESTAEGLSLRQGREQGKQIA